jgi:hypothetical protein
MPATLRYSRENLPVKGDQRAGFLTPKARTTVRGGSKITVALKQNLAGSVPNRNR